MKRISSTLLTVTTLASVAVSPFAAHAQTVAHIHASPSLASHTSPYAGEQAREIKARSKTDVNNLMVGAGVGYAKAAELNGYPGRMHVLELARPMRLTEAQRSDTEKLLREHKQEAREIGSQIVARERQLDAAFAAKTVTDATLSKLTNDIALLQEKLRNEHLQTHLLQTELLLPDQIAAYQKLPGYATGDTILHH